MTDVKDGVERRRHPRFDLLAQIRVKRGSVTYVLELRNISESGALVHTGTLKTPTWLRPLRDVELNILNPEDLEPVHAKGKVVRVSKVEDGTLFAVQFEEIDDSTRVGITNLMNLGEAQVVPPPLPPSIRG